MTLNKASSGFLRRIRTGRYRFLDDLYLPVDREQIRRTQNIRLIPGEKYRRGGKYSYAEWAHVIGIFQTLIFTQLRQKENNIILDAGCGTGLLGIASEPFLGQEGKYIGIDVKKDFIDYCRGHYPPANFEFIHLDIDNPTYNRTGKEDKLFWPVDNESIDLTTALSVWTHLNEEDALFYFKELSRVLKPGGKAIVTFFLLDEAYESATGARTEQSGRFHATRQDKWIFDQPSYGSDAWFHPHWVRVPEDAIGVSEIGLERLLEDSGMKLIEHHQGNWKEVPDIYFQDVLIFQKA